MSIALIYQHHERAIAEEFRLHLENKGYEITLAPLGYEVGNETWKTIVRSDLESAELALALLTKKSANDEWVKWRASICINDDRTLLLPVILEGDIPSEDLFPFWQYRQTIPFLAGTNEEQLSHIVDAIYRILPPLSLFISYSRDDREYAGRLITDLRDVKFSVWIDEESIKAGAPWDMEIQNALKRSTHVLLVATPKSVQSQNVADEISFALDNRKLVIPLIFEKCELPLRVHRAQWISFEDDYGKGFFKLIHQLGRKVYLNRKPRSLK